MARQDTRIIANCEGDVTYEGFVEELYEEENNTPPPLNPDDDPKFMYLRYPAETYDEFYIELRDRREQDLKYERSKQKQDLRDARKSAIEAWVDDSVVYTRILNNLNPEGLEPSLYAPFYANAGRLGKSLEEMATALGAPKCTQAALPADPQDPETLNATEASDEARPSSVAGPRAGPSTAPACMCPDCMAATFCNNYRPWSQPNSKIGTPMRPIPPGKPMTLLQAMHLKPRSYSRDEDE